MRDADVLTVVGHRTVADVLRAGAERTPDRILLVFDDLDGSVQEFTWKDVLERSYVDRHGAGRDGSVSR